MVLPPSYTALRSAVSVFLLLLTLALAPLAVAQDIHHALAAADTDGHEHSDNDLCQWVQHHTSDSINLGGPILSAWEVVSLSLSSPPSLLLSGEFAYLSPSRAPPRK